MDVHQELSALEAMTPTQLRERYADLYGDRPSTGNKAFLTKRIIWRMQANEMGDFEQRMQRIRAKALGLARDSDLRTTAPKRMSSPTGGTQVKPTSIRPASPMTPGTQLERVYKRKKVVVTVLEDGFAYEGVKFRSLSAAARAITGTHISGNAFFKINSKGGNQ